ncbi:hypothetical protein [Mitsuaria sp. TWR114]|uniref:hypothetical protein n=1 Tax=Mitsuaria sp. TWR114 TaxID=2601731 RepID=UPI00164B16A9|nr:hypothetical protein [Mitsuaria sp. TWR114]
MQGLALSASTSLLVFGHVDPASATTSATTQAVKSTRAAAATPPRIKTLAVDDLPPLTIIAGQFALVSYDNSVAAGTPGAGGSSEISPNGHTAPAVAAAAGWNLEVAGGSVVQGGATQPALALQSNGGRGGDGGNAHSTSGYGNGGAAAFGSNAGPIYLNLDAGSDVSSAGTSPTVALSANGGAGGNGGTPNNDAGKSGQGGLGGDGGTVQATLSGSIHNDATYTGTALNAAAVSIRSIGGDGGGTHNDTARTTVDHASGNPGGTGGTGGSITVDAFNPDSTQAPASISSTGSGISALSAGGNGGWGAFAHPSLQASLWRCDRAQATQLNRRMPQAAGERKTCVE